MELWANFTKLGPVLVIVVMVVAVLLPGVASVSLALTLATFVAMPSTNGKTTRLMLVEAPLARLPRLHATTPEASPQPVDAGLKLTSSEIVFVNVMPVAVLGPLL